MICVAWIIALVGMCVELAGMLGLGWSWTLTGAVLTILGGVLWGLFPPKSAK